mmetsp:Transcript_23679/g.42243  ORF Transcript_23679/g.42243 Transcript_23679/m.42243 type:complete len:226 (-) Transcript_23679:2411-3088(-)
MVALMAARSSLKPLSAQTSSTGWNRPASTKGAMRLPGYQLVTSGASAVKKFRIAVLCASRSLMLTITLMSGFSDLNNSTASSKPFLGPGFRSSKLMTRSRAKADPAIADRAIAATAVLTFRNMVSSLSSVSPGPELVSLPRKRKVRFLLTYSLSSWKFHIVKLNSNYWNYAATQPLRQQFPECGLISGWEDRDEHASAPHRGRHNRQGTGCAGPHCGVGTACAVL